MLLLTAITFGGQEGVASLDHLAPEEGELLQHRAQEIMQIPREKRIPLLVQEIKRLVKDRRGQLWSAEPEKLAALLQKERGALVEVVLRALPGVLAEAVRAHVPQQPVKLTREVRPQVLDIVRWKLEQRLTRGGSGRPVSFKFTDVLMLQHARAAHRLRSARCARAGPGAGGAFGGAARRPGRRRCRRTMKSAGHQGRRGQRPAQAARGGGQGAARGARRPEEPRRAPSVARAFSAWRARASLSRLSSPRACWRSTAGSSARLLARWVRDERSRPISRTTDGGRADIVADLERLAVRGLIERPVRLTPAAPGAQPASGAQQCRRARAAAQRVSRDGAARASTCSRAGTGPRGAPASSPPPAPRRGMPWPSARHGERASPAPPTRETAAFAEIRWPSARPARRVRSPRRASRANRKPLEGERLTPREGRAPARGSRQQRAWAAGSRLGRRGRGAGSRRSAHWPSALA